MAGRNRVSNALITKRMKIKIPPPSKVAIKIWLETLPLANINLSVRRIILTLRKLKNNTVQPNPKNWFEILELFHPKINYFSAQLRRKYLEDLSPQIQKEKQQLIILAYLLQNEMAKCYSILVSPSVVTVQNREIVITSIYRAITYLTQVLVGSYELYRQPPTDIWQQFNTLYYSAEQNKLEEDIIKDTTSLFTNKNKTISNAYKRALLLCTANPSQLSRNDIGKLYEVLGYWSNRAHLHCNRHTNNLYSVSLDSTQGPSFSVLTKPIMNTTNCRTLDTDELCHYLENILNENSSSTSTIQLDEEKISLNKALIQTLLQNWNHRRMRFTERAADQGELGVCVGLSATHYYLNQGDDSLSMLGSIHKSYLSTHQTPSIDIASRATIPLIPPSGHTTLLTSARKTMEPRLEQARHSTGWSKEKNGIPLRRKLEIPDINKNLLKNTASHQHRIHLWQIVNKSQQGYCLRPVDNSLSHVQPGVIIGIQQKNDRGASSWQIYAIRWVQSDNHQSIQVGVQLLAIHADPIALEGSRQLRQLRGLLLDELMSHTKSLIIPAIPYKAGDVVRVSSKNKQYLVKLLQQLVSNHSYCQFSYLLLSTGRLHR